MHRIGTSLVRYFPTDCFIIVMRLQVACQPRAIRVPAACQSVARGLYADRTPIVRQPRLTHALNVIDRYLDLRSMFD